MPPSLSQLFLSFPLYWKKEIKQNNLPFSPALSSLAWGGVSGKRTIRPNTWVRCFTWVPCLAVGIASVAYMRRPSESYVWEVCRRAGSPASQRETALASQAGFHDLWRKMQYPLYSPRCLCHVVCCYCSFVQFSCALCLFLFVCVCVCVTFRFYRFFAIRFCWDFWNFSFGKQSSQHICLSWPLPQTPPTR